VGGDVAVRDREKKREPRGKEKEGNVGGDWGKGVEPFSEYLKNPVGKGIERKKEKVEILSPDSRNLPASRRKRGLPWDSDRWKEKREYGGGREAVIRFLGKALFLKVKRRGKLARPP